MTGPVAGLGPVHTDTATSKLQLLDNILSHRDLLKKVFPTWDDRIFQESLMARIQALGSERMVTTLNASFYQQDSAFAPVTVQGAAAAGGDATACVITYTAGSITTSNSLRYSPGGVQEVIMKSSSPIRALITAKSEPTEIGGAAHTITVRGSGLTGQQLADHFVAGSIISFGGATKSELQVFGTGDVQLLDRYDLVFQKLPGFTPLMSNEFNSELNVMSYGSSYPMVSTVALNLLKMQIRKALSLIIGSGATFSATNSAAANEVEGVWTIGRNHGKAIDWSRTASAGLTLSYLTSIGRYAQANQMGPNLDFNVGYNLNASLQNWLNSGGVNPGSVNFNTNTDTKDRMMNFASQSFVMPDGTQMNLIAEPAFSHPGITATSTVDAENYFPHAGWITSHLNTDEPYNSKLGKFGQKGGPIDIEVLVYGQTQGAAMTDKVKVLSVYRGPAETNTEAGEVKWTEQYTLRLAATNKVISIGPVA